MKSSDETVTAAEVGTTAMLGPFDLRRLIEMWEQSAATDERRAAMLRRRDAVGHCVCIAHLEACALQARKCAAGLRKVLSHA